MSNICLVPVTSSSQPSAAQSQITTGMVYQSVQVDGECPPGSISDMTSNYILVGTLSICFVLGWIKGAQR